MGGGVRNENPQPSIILGKPAEKPQIMWPFTASTANFSEGRPPAQDMLRSDTRLFSKWMAPPKSEPWKGPPWRMPEQTEANTPWTPQGGSPAPDATDPSEIRELQSYLQSVDSNHLVPAPEEGEEKDDGPKWEFGQAERKTEDGGTSEEWRRGVREYIKSGYTRRNPDGTHEVDSDWRGKWRETEYTIAEVSDRTDKAEVSVADGSFGNADSLFSGDGQVLGAEADAGYKGAITSKGLEASADAQASAYAAQGKIESADDGLLSGEAEGAALKADAEAQGEVMLTAEQATLGGKLGASANLVEGKIGGEFGITPTRISRAAVSLYNWALDENATALSDDWDFGIAINLEVSAAVGAQAGAEAEAGYKNGKLRAEAGAKLGLGAGAGVKVGGGLTGLDKAWARIKDAWNAIWN